MRVLHLGAGNLLGGVERTLLTLWRARGACPRLRPHFALCFDARLADELRRAQAPVTICGPLRASNPFSLWRARRRLRACLRAEGFDVAVAHGLWAQVVLGPAVRAAGVRLATWAHDVPARRDPWARRAARRPPELLLANSRYTAARAGEVFGSGEVHVQYPPAELGGALDDAPPRSVLGRDVRAELGTREDAFVVLIAARLQPSKGHAILISALARLPQRLGWECWIAGAPQRPAERVYRQVIEHLVAAVGIEPRVRMLGHRDDVARLLSAADVLCQPNTAPEGFGLTFVEAMAAGVPVVTTHLGAAPELIDESCGLLVAPNDPDDVAQALQRVAGGWPADSASRARARALELCSPERALPRLHAILDPLGANDTHRARTMR